VFGATVLIGEAFRRWLRDEGSSLVNDFKTLIKEASQSVQAFSPFCLLPYKDMRLQACTIVPGLFVVFTCILWITNELRHSVIYSLASIFLTHELCFTAVLGRRKYGHFLYVLCPNICTNTIGILYQKGTCVMIKESTLIHHYYPKSMVYIRALFWFWQCIMTYQPFFVVC
jgi:hypothetical protein